MEICSTLMMPVEIPQYHICLKKGSDKKKIPQLSKNHKTDLQLLGEKNAVDPQNFGSYITYMLTCRIARHTFGLCFL